MAFSPDQGNCDRKLVKELKNVQSVICGKFKNPFLLS